MYVRPLLLGSVADQPVQTELALNTHITISDMRHDMSKIREKWGVKPSLQKPGWLL